MKDSKLYSVSPKIFTLISLMVLLFVFARCSDDDVYIPILEIKTFASGLAGPMGIETDGDGNVWVTEAGTDVPDEDHDTHNNNGKVILITPDGQKYDAFVNLESYANVHSGELQGTVHILRDG